MIAVISDIHGNLEALEAVLDDARREEAEVVISLGDVVGYGADPNECMSRVKAEAKVSVLGNHDAAACDLREAENFNDIAREAIRWTQERLTPENRDILQSVPLEFVERDARFVHASACRGGGHGIQRHWGDSVGLETARGQWIRACDGRRKKNG